MNIPSNQPVSARDLQAVNDGYATKSDRIRVLAQKGYARARIADALGIKYQFVRNVLEAPGARRPSASGPDADPAGFAEHVVSTAELAPPGRVFRMVLENGAVRLPERVQEELGLRDGLIVVAQLEDGAFTLLSPLEAGRRAQAMLRPWQTGERLLSEELIEERRAEARRESDD